MQIADLLIFIVLVISALGLLLGHDIKSGDAIATLVGALFGAAALLLGNYINRRNERRKAREDLEERARKLKALIAAELVSVSTGLIGAKRTMDAAVATATSGGTLSNHADLTQDSPRPMPFTDNLGPELLVLDQRDIDVLTTLRGNLAVTKMVMDEVTSGRRQFGLLAAQQILTSVQHAMGQLAEAFERLAPARKFALPDKDPDLASTILRQLAGDEQCQQAHPETVAQGASMTSSKNRKRLWVASAVVLCVIGIASAPSLYEILSISNASAKYRLDQSIRSQEIDLATEAHDQKNLPSASELFNGIDGSLSTVAPLVKKYRLDVGAQSDSYHDYSPTGYHWKRWNISARTVAIMMLHGKDNLGTWKMWRVSRCIDHYYAENKDTEPVSFVLNGCVTLLN
ncbi:hypothetical protein BH160DRAFT_2429 [Burkholderia sp. H160]|nr:hypothetical protein BH160DRAFT_2429 [Burkholderia sp. H160]